MGSTLDLSVELETDPDVWVQLEDEEGGYSIGDDTFSQQSVSLRRVLGPELPWLEGRNTILAVPENVTEQVALYVTGASPFEFQSRIKVVTDTLVKLRWRLRYRIEDLQVTWDCLPSDYSVETQKAFWFATMGLVRAQVEHKPTVTVEQVVL